MREIKDFMKCVLLCFCSVLEMRVESSMSWMEPGRFMDMYLVGRSKSTFPTYDMAFQKLWFYGREIGKFPFWWSDIEFAGHMVLLNDNEASVNMFKQALAMMTLLKELVGFDTVVGSSVVQNFKRVCMKAARERAAKREKKEGDVINDIGSCSPVD